MTVNDARVLADALRATMPEDRLALLRWVAAVESLRGVLEREIPVLDMDAWEALCYE